MHTLFEIKPGQKAIVATQTTEPDAMAACGAVSSASVHCPGTHAVLLVDALVVKRRADLKMGIIAAILAVSAGTAAACPVPEPNKFLEMLAGGAEECGLKIDTTAAYTLALSCGVSPSLFMNPQPLGLNEDGRRVLCPQIEDAIQQLGL